ncbi:MAG: hypothetical protein M3R00_05305, partial [Pseudomonadota bacterium]|nr:hypothetical protein [Pseudomonadota bacterium]
LTKAKVLYIHNKLKAQIDFTGSKNPPSTICPVLRFTKELDDTQYAHLFVCEEFSSEDRLRQFIKLSSDSLRDELIMMLNTNQRVQLFNDLVKIKPEYAKRLYKVLYDLPTQNGQRAHHELAKSNALSAESAAFIYDMLGNNAARATLFIDLSHQNKTKLIKVLFKQHPERVNEFFGLVPQPYILNGLKDIKELTLDDLFTLYPFVDDKYRDDYINQLLLPKYDLQDAKTNADIIKKHVDKIDLVFKIYSQSKKLITDEDFAFLEEVGKQLRFEVKDNFNNAVYEFLQKQKEVDVSNIPKVFAAG